jgi:hypothetical protein
MKTRIPSPANRKRQHQAGMATIVVITILSILLIFAMGNARTLDYLGRDLRLLEQQHQHRIAAQVAATGKTNVTVSAQPTPSAP